MGKRSSSQTSQVCQSLKEEKIVVTSTKLESVDQFLPETIITVGCKTKDQRAPGVDDVKVFCRTKEGVINVFKIKNGTPVEFIQVPMPVDCVAYRRNY